MTTVLLVCWVMGMTGWLALIARLTKDEEFTPWQIGLIAGFAALWPLWILFVLMLIVVGQLHIGRGDGR